MTESEKKYGDIIGFPHHVSTVHPQMSIYDRATQFSPFAALTGHEAAIRETARLTEQEAELDEDKKAELNEKMQELMKYAAEHPTEHPLVSVTYFKPDDRKAGGRYETVTGRFRKISDYDRTFVLDDEICIDCAHIYDIEIII